MKKFIGHRYDDIGRIYQFDDGSEYYSVTTMLGATGDKTHLERWRNRIGHAKAERQTKYAGDIGTAMHEYLEYYLINGYEPKGYDSVVVGLARQIIPYLNKRVIATITTEQVLYSDTLKLAGTMDALVRYHIDKPIVTVLDFKTSKKKKKIEWITDYIFQLSAYSYMLHETHHVDAPQGVLLFAYKELRDPHNEVIANLTKAEPGMLKRNELFQKKLLTHNS